MTLWRRENRAADCGKLFHSCYEQATGIEFVAGTAIPIDLDLTLRVAADGAENEQIKISVNGFDLLQVPGNAVWQRVQTVIPPDFIRPGVNTIHVTWPLKGLQQRGTQPWLEWGAIEQIIMHLAS